MPPCAVLDRTLKAKTEKMQKMLKDVGYGQLLGKHGPNKDGLDDKFGPDTQNTVRAFQQANGLTPTGVMDENTANKLMDAHKSMKPELYASASAQGPTAAPATHTPDMAYNYQTAPSPLSLTGLNQQSPESGSISALFKHTITGAGRRSAKPDGPDE
jgi:peptidoglycan hydrolase-like protein with peptidoglycan-binding domain